MFENSEIMSNYANIVTSKQLKKYAWTSRDLVKGLGMEALFTGGAAGAGAAGLIGSGGGAAGAAAAVGLGSNPVGWVIGAVLMVGGVGYTIYSVVTNTDSKLTDLIERAEALDYEDTPAEGVVEGWIVKLNEAKAAIQWPSLAGMSDEEKGMSLGSLVIETRNTQKLLSDMYGEFDDIKDELEDWTNFVFNDPEDFKYALVENQKYISIMLKKIQSKAYSAGKSVMNSLGNPVEIISQIQNLDTKITLLWAKPSYSESEKRTIGFGQKMLSGKVTSQEAQVYFKALVNLKISLETKILPKAIELNKTLKTASKKVAVTLPKDPTAGVRVNHPKQTTRTKDPRAKSINKLDTVYDMQNQINRLAIAKDIPIGSSLVVDGRYGQLTAKALTTTLQFLASNSDPEKFPSQAKALAKLKHRGINLSMISNPEFMNKKPEYLNELTNLVDEIFVSHMGGGGTKPISKRVNQPTGSQQSQPQSGAECNPDQQNPSRENTLKCFKRLNYNIGGVKTNLYDYAVQNRGMSDNDIFNLIYSKFPGWAPKAWSVAGLVEALVTRDSIR